MDWPALALSFRLAAVTVLLLMPVAVLLGHALATRAFAFKRTLEALILLPLVLPPTVLGYYLLQAFGQTAPLGALWSSLTGSSLAFSFPGLVLASLLFNLPFAVQPSQRGFESIAPEIRDAAACSGLSPWQSLLRIELPLAWPGLLTAAVMTFAHTLGEFGIVLMVGGAIPSETRTVSIAIYDDVQRFDMGSAGLMSALLVAVSLGAIALTLRLSAKPRLP
ncbi:MAG: molybdate ABC transporter permease subunit [Polymorphobacter sp.]|uniref:molybdate ABC transporter permease subunit n=1 Tax=Polymorphobacter sp. TaxID=1909290 RepID=UPI003A889080